jgi:hypothetical protein
MKIELERSKSSNPLTSNPGQGNSMSPSPSSEGVKGSANRGNTPESTTRNTKSMTGTGPDELKGESGEESGEKSAAGNQEQSGVKLRGQNQPKREPGSQDGKQPQGERKAG